MPINILNLNTSFDRWVILEKEPRIENVVKGDSGLSIASGKGLDVARALHNLNFHDYQCINIVGGDIGRIIQKTVVAEGVRAVFFSIAEESRINTVVVRAYENTSLVINEPGPAMSSEEKKNLHAFLQSTVVTPCPLVLSGSVPKNFSAQDVCELLRHFHERGCPLHVDIADETLRHAVILPLSLVKVNEAEFTIAFEKEARDLKVLQAFYKQHAIQTLVVTLAEEGALICCEGMVLKGEFTHAMSGIAVGSGDSFFGGWLYAQERRLGVEERLRWALACGAANLKHYGAAVFSSSDVRSIMSQVRIRRLV